MDDIIHNPSYSPSFPEITGYLNPPARVYWEDLNQFIQSTFKAAPKIQYSICAGKPGWNVKYQKSGKAICTLYPEKDCLIALVVIKLELAALLQKADPAPHPLIHNLISTARPFNNTIWLMIPVGDADVVEGVKDLLVQKRSF